MAATMVVLPMTAQAAVVKSDYYNPAENWLTTLGNVNELTSCGLMISRENELRMPSAAGNDDLRSAERRPPPRR